MPVQGSGQISADDIRDEFGPLNGSVSFDDYRVSEDHGSLQNMPLDQRAGANQDTDIPSSGAIRFSNFYNGKLNVVTRITQNDRSARNEYDNNTRTNVVGGLRGRPSANDMAGRKVFININDDIGGDEDNANIQNACALRTGEWNEGAFPGAGTSVSVDIGSEGRIFGTGGEGGRGGTADTGGEAGRAGSSALGIEHGSSNNRVQINNRGYIQAGYGGGGGGGGGWDDPSKESEDHVAAGGGGAGGAGFIIGEGGEGATGWKGQQGENGQNGALTDGGEGGEGPDGGGEAKAGDGGDGRSPDSPNVNNAEGGSGNVRETEGGAAGANGWAIINEDAAAAISINNLGSGSVAEGNTRVTHNTNPL